MRKSTRYSLFAVALFATLAAAVYLYVSSPPGTARLLPECDAIVYVNLKPLRSATHFERTAVTRTAEFQQFVDATGIVPERDLDDVAFALHRMADPSGPNGPVAYSEVFAGRFDAARLTRYLSTIASIRETYAGHEIFTLPAGDPQSLRQLRVTLLDRGTIAVSNTPTPEQIHAILDRHRTGLAPFSGPTLLNGLYGEVPAFSSAWGIGHIGLPFAESGFVNAFGLRLPLTEDTTFIASLRYLGSVHLRVEALTPPAAVATQTAHALASMLSLLKSVLLNQSGTSSTSAPLREFLDSLQITPVQERVVVTDTIPLELLRKFATPSDQAPSTHSPASH